MNSACPRRASLITSRGLPTILSPTISALTGARPVASGFIPASTGFAFFQQTRPSTPTESSSRRLPLRGRLCYGLVVLVPLLSTPHRCDAVTVRYRTALHRTEADFHRSIPLPSQAHERGHFCPQQQPSGEPAANPWPADFQKRLRIGMSALRLLLGGSTPPNRPYSI